MTAFRLKNGTYRIDGRIMKHRRAIQYAASKGARTIVVIDPVTKEEVASIDVYMMR